MNPTFALTASVDWFLDGPGVMAFIDEARQSALSKQGAFVRRRARTRLRRRKRVSAPGEPPSVHSGDSFATLKNIRFVYDQVTDTVVVGPVKLNQVQQLEGTTATVPEILEHGGTATIDEVSWDSVRWFRRDKRRGLRPNQLVRRRRAVYMARPNIVPSLEAEVAAGTILDCWRDAVR